LDLLSDESLVFASVATDATDEVKKWRALSPPPSVRAVARHLPVFVDEDLVPVIPDRTTAYNPKRLTVNDINWQSLQ
jgi:hypothetical protein